MNYHLTDFPLVVLALSFLLLWLSGWLGTWFRNKKQKTDEGASADAGLILGATLTLLGLIIGFTFSMAISRYEERKHYEAEEANAIGTEYVRGDVLPAGDAQRLRALLAEYTKQRILFYEASHEQQLRRVNTDTAQLQKELWSSVVGPANSQTTPLTALAVSGMNDVLNSQGYTQAAWWNRIPASAWSLMLIIALCCNLLIGYSTRRTRAESVMFLVMTLIVAVSFFLIADIDSPRGGIIRVQPENLVGLSQSFHPQ
jgi:lipopolysaccharide export LptBFGC system permease protein LptF